MSYAYGRCFGDTQRGSVTDVLIGCGVNICDFYILYLRELFGYFTRFLTQVKNRPACDQRDVTGLYPDHSRWFTWLSAWMA